MLPSGAVQFLEMIKQSPCRRNKRTGIIKADNEIAFPGQLEGEAPHCTARSEPDPAAGAQESGPLRVSPGGLLVSGEIGVVAPELPIVLTDRADGTRYDTTNSASHSKVIRQAR